MSRYLQILHKFVALSLVIKHSIFGIESVARLTSIFYMGDVNFTQKIGVFKC